MARAEMDFLAASLSDIAALNVSVEEPHLCELS